MGNSIANADPSAQIPLVAVTLGAEIMLATPDGLSSMPADDFFISPMLTTIAPGGCVSARQVSGLGAQKYRRRLLRDPVHASLISTFPSGIGTASA